MGQTHLLLAGMEPGYMKKLALYIRTYRPDVDYVSILENSFTQKQYEGFGPDGGLKQDREGERLTILAGSRKAVDEMARTDAAGSNGIYIVLYTDPEDAVEGAVYAYQSADVICQEIFGQIQKEIAGLAQKMISARVRWTIVTGTVCKGDLLSFALTCAQYQAQKEETVFLNLCGVSGMNRLLSLEPPGKDLTDLILEGRKKESAIDGFIGRIGEVSYIPPAENPTVLYEITPEDVRSLVNMLEKSGRFSAAVVMLSDMIPGSTQLFDIGSRIYCLRGQELPHLLQKDELYQFYTRSGGRGEKWEDVVCHPQKMTAPGPHLIYEWLQGEMGNLVRKVVNHEYRTCDFTDQRTDFS